MNVTASPAAIERGPEVVAKEPPLIEAPVLVELALAAPTPPHETGMNGRVGKSFE
jgi:hypothetical protein